MNLKPVLILIFLSQSALSQSALSEPIFKATYELKWGIMKIGTVVRTLSKTDGIYTFISNTKPEGLAVFLSEGIDEKSIFKLSDGKLRPISYQIKERNKNFSYRYTGNDLKISGDKELTIKNIPDNSMDYLNATYMIMLRVKNQQNLFSFVIHEPKNEPDIFEFIVKNKEKIKVPAGEFSTILVEKIKTDRSEFKMWLSEKHQYLPVEISNTNSEGHNFTMKLTEFSLQ